MLKNIFQPLFGLLRLWYFLYKYASGICIKNTSLRPPLPFIFISFFNFYLLHLLPQAPPALLFLLAINISPRWGFKNIFSFLVPNYFAFTRHTTFDASSVTNSCPERTGEFVCLLLIISHPDGALKFFAIYCERNYWAFTRHTIFDASSATKRDPSFITVTQTGLPCTSSLD